MVIYAILPIYSISRILDKVSSVTPIIGITNAYVDFLKVFFIPPGIPPGVGGTFYKV